MMSNFDRMRRQWELMDAAAVSFETLRQAGNIPHLPSQYSIEVLATLVLAARVEALEDMLASAIPIAGEGR